MAIKFNGGSGLINCGSAATLDNLTASTFSISAWVCAYSQGEATNGVIVSKDATGADGWTVRFRGTVANAISFQVDHLTTNLLVESSANSLKMGQPNHVVVTTTGAGTRATCDIIVNGTSVKSAGGSDSSGARGSDAAQTVCIGNNLSDTNTWDGWICHVALFNKVLTAAEIQQIYQGTRVPKPLPSSLVDASCLAYWKCDEGSSGIVPSTAGYVLDSSSGGNHGTQSNDPYYIGVNDRFMPNNIRPRPFAPGIAR